MQLFSNMTAEQEKALIESAVCGTVRFTLDYHGRDCGDNCGGCRHVDAVPIIEWFI
jgi:hypothetical protein